MHFETIIFAGGGNRCFWQAGFWQALAPALTKPPERLLGVSAGALVACSAQAGLVEAFLACHRQVFDRNSRNFYLRRLLQMRNPFPHPRMLREGIRDLFDAPAMARLRAGIPVYVLASVLPASLPAPLASLLVQAAYIAERWAGRKLHGDWGRHLGFEPYWQAAAHCVDAAQLRELLVASSAIPPVFRIQRLAGRRMMDGGFVGNALIRFNGPSLGRRLVLVTRDNWPIPVATADLVYARPSRKVAVSKLDVTSGDRIQAAFDLGFEDGCRFVQAGCRSA